MSDDLQEFVSGVEALQEGEASLEYQEKIPNLGDQWVEAPEQVEDYFREHTDCKIDTPFSDLYVDRVSKNGIVYKDVYRRNHRFEIVRH